MARPQIQVGMPVLHASRLSWVKPTTRAVRYTDLLSGPAKVVEIARTPAHFGGERLWYVCPACSRRCVELYDMPKQLACRKCQGLVYPSQYEKRQHAPHMISESGANA